MYRPIRLPDKAARLRLRYNIGLQQIILMSKLDKLLEQVLRGSSDANTNFGDLCRLLRSLGFTERTRGSHHIFTKAGVVERVNLQREGNNAKVYQVRQVRAVIAKYKLGGE